MSSLYLGKPAAKTVEFIEKKWDREAVTFVFRDGTKYLKMFRGIFDGNSLDFLFRNKIKEIKLGRNVKKIVSEREDPSKSLYPNLETVVIGSNVEEVGTYQFAGCPKLRNVYICPGVKKLDSCFCFNDELEEIHIPAGVIEVTANTFYGCSSLRKITIGENTEAFKVMIQQSLYDSNMYNIPVEFKPDSEVSIPSIQGVIPELPDNPDTPDTPDFPVIPDDPEDPTDQPENPEEPEDPETPGEEDQNQESTFDVEKGILVLAEDATFENGVLTLGSASEFDEGTKTLILNS